MVKNLYGVPGPGKLTVSPKHKFLSWQISLLCIVVVEVAGGGFAINRAILLVLRSFDFISTKVWCLSMHSKKPNCKYILEDVTKKRMTQSKGRKQIDLLGTFHTANPINFLQIHTWVKQVTSQHLMESPWLTRGLLQYNEPPGMGVPPNINSPPTGTSKPSATIYALTDCVVSMQWLFILNLIHIC